MSSVRLLLVAGLAVSVSAVAVAQVGTLPPLGATPERVAAIENCKGRWFSASVIIDPATKRGTRIRLCSKEGASDAEWVATLKAAADQLTKRVMPAAPKARLLAEINAAIAKVGTGASAPPPAVAPPPLAPSLPAPTSPPPAPAPAPVATAAAPTPVAKPTAPAPSVVITCAERGQPGAGACGLVGRDTILVIRAVGGLEQGARLRLLRRGEQRGEIALAPMRSGQSVRAGLPDRLCLGVNSSKVEFQLAGAAGSTGQRFGPYSLRC